MVEQVSFVTDGCGPSLAAGSMATSLARGKPIAEVMKIGQRDILDALGGLPTESEHCPLLAANTLKAACQNYLGVQARGPGKPTETKTTNKNTGKSEMSDLERKPGENDEQFEERKKLHYRLNRIHHKVVVLSGKGGCRQKHSSREPCNRP